MRKERTWILVLLASFSLMTLLLYLFKEREISEVLAQEQARTVLEYKAMYASMRSIASVAHEGIVSRKPLMQTIEQAMRTPDVQKRNRLRQEIFERLESTYRLLKSLNVMQVHFHDRENRSFLRMHKPDLFGDDLSDIRDSVRVCNATQQPTEGFEQGRLHHGFRFVYPLTGADGTHLGSVEISFSANAFIHSFREQFGLHVHFIEQRDILEQKILPQQRKNYAQSLEHPDYLFNLDTEDPEFPIHPHDAYRIIHFSEREIEQGIATRAPFSVKAKYDNRAFSVVFIPIDNMATERTVAYMVVYKPSRHIAMIQQDTVIYAISLLLLHLLLYLLLSRHLRYEERLQHFNLQLSNEVDRLVQEEKRKQSMLLHQSRLAQMGELLSMIAHQWRQPLGAIGAVTSKARVYQDLGELTPDELERMLTKVDELIAHMSETITRFMQFYQPGDDTVCARTDELADRAVEMIRGQLDANGIAVELDLNIDESVFCYGNELEQVFLNLLQNAKDELLLREIEKPRIEIHSQDEGSWLLYRFADNAGGVRANDLEKIFDPYFTTKANQNGTGLGLYMSKMIIEEHFKGMIRVRNDEEGAVFLIKIPKEPCPKNDAL